MRFWCLVPFTIKVRKSSKGRDNWERSGSVGFHSPTIYKNSKRTTSALWSQESISATSIRHNSPTSPLNWATTKVKKWVTCSGLLFNSSNNKERKPMFMVHCAAGISRCSVILIAYLIENYGWTFDKCLQQLQCARPCCRPNMGFIKQLQ